MADQVVSMASVSKMAAEPHDLDCEVSPYEIWDSLTAVEETALHVALFRFYGCQLPDIDTPLYDGSYDKAIVEACMPAEEQAKFHKHTDAHHMMAVRTAEIDSQIMDIVRADPQGHQQLVILGAGLDNRAWRLHWPDPAMTVFEVDTGAVEHVKLRALRHFHLRARRVFVQADLSRVDDFQRTLLAAGLQPQRPVTWLLEGLVGYLTPRQSFSLFRAMHALSPPGSAVIMTCPPTRRHKEEYEANGLKLHHITFEDPWVTFRRLKRAGWDGAVTCADALSQKYKLKARLAQVVGYKPDRTGPSVVLWAALHGAGQCWPGAAALGLAAAAAVIAAAAMSRSK